MPQRIQRRRTAGWRMPEGAVYVGRPGPYGNPFRRGDDSAESWAYAVELFRRFLRLWPNGEPDALYPYLSVAVIRADLGGKDLACWCPLARPCHADILLEVANPS